MELQDFNPWWRDGKVPPGLLGRKRKIFGEIMKYLDKRQIVLLTGLRRVGKTTLMYQIINNLLRKGVSPYNILYFSFDEMRYDIESIVKQFEADILRDDILKNKVFIFFDEIQKLDDWPSKVKLLYDANPKAKIFLTGSAQISMWRGTRESLAGRFFDLVLKPLDFEEYLDFKGIEIDRDREKVFEKDLKRHMNGFLKTGGFIEALDLDEHMLRKYLKESLLERVIFVDIPQTFKLDLPELLMKLFAITASRPGFYLDYRNLSDDLKVDQRTIASYVSYLEYALFLQKLYNYSPNLLTSEKKVKKLYPSNTAFTLALNPQTDLASILEQFFVNNLEARFFLKTPQKEEIDIIHVHDKHVLPVEIEIKEKIGRGDTKVLFRFLEKNGLQRALLITRDTETKFQDAKLVVEAIPYWKYWSIRKRIG
ncbi:MAG: ATP-binding protein [Candidatus Eisenbacteria bacterium]|nr:ATP-binding protein [Candidatus Eisenbacteria bacterium]